MGPSFSEQFDQFGHWRQGFASQLTDFGEWLSSQDLLDDAVRGHLQRLAHALRDDRFGVAFVSEFSRGKSELINAVFFSHYGRRIMPTTAGRTTMCSTELSYDPALPPCLRLLPVETRSQPYSLAEWRSMPSTWIQLPLDVHDATQLAQNVASVAQTRKVTIEEARSLGFWSDAVGADNPEVDGQGLVDIPRWRHALINMEHPLLQQGLVIVDTPGLNAVGTEPELTVNLIAQAHVVVFMLAADAGVTPKDLSVWQEHLLPSQRSGDANLVVLNKIDALWDGVSTDAQAQEKLGRLRDQSAKALGISPERVVPVSAQNGWIGKLEGHKGQLQASGLPLLENLLAQRAFRQRQSVLHQVVDEAVAQLKEQLLRAAQIRQLGWMAQKQELQALWNKDGASLDSVRQHIEQESRTLDACASSIAALRNEHLKLMNHAFQYCGATSLRKELDQLTGALEHSGLDVGVHHVYASTFERLHAILGQIKAAAGEVQSMLTNAFSKFNAEFGFSLQAPSAVSLGDFERELARIAESYLQYLGFGHAKKLAHPLFGQRMVSVLGLRLRNLFDGVGNTLDLWSKSTISQLDAQFRERKRSFARRIEAVDRIREASSEWMVCMTEVDSALQRMHNVEASLDKWMQQLLQRPPFQVTALPASLEMA